MLIWANFTRGGLNLKVYYAVGRIRAAGSSHIKTGHRHPLSNQFRRQLIIPLKYLKTGPRVQWLLGTCELGTRKSIQALNLLRKNLGTSFKIQILDRLKNLYAENFNKRSKVHEKIEGTVESCKLTGNILTVVRPFDAHYWRW